MLAMVNDPTEPNWSSEVGEADWIAERLSPFDDHVVTSVVPGGFEAYAEYSTPPRLHAVATVVSSGGGRSPTGVGCPWVPIPSSTPSRCHQPIPPLTHRGEEKVRVLGACIQPTLKSWLQH